MIERTASILNDGITRHIARCSGRDAGVDMISIGLSHLSRDPVLETAGEMNNDQSSVEAKHRCGSGIPKEIPARRHLERLWLPTTLPCLVKYGECSEAQSEGVVDCDPFLSGKQK